MAGTRCSWMRAPSHPSPPRSGESTDEMTTPLPCTTKCFSRLKTSLAERQEGFFSSLILILCSQVCEKDDRSPKRKPRPADFSFWLPPPTHPTTFPVTFSSSRKLAAKLLESGR